MIVSDGSSFGHDLVRTEGRVGRRPMLRRKHQREADGQPEGNHEPEHPPDLPPASELGEMPRSGAEMRQ